MFKNLLLVALRNFKRDIWYSLLNLMGLSIGITFSLLLIFYIKDEWSYDRYNEHADHIYRISSYIKELDKPMLKWTSTQVPLGPTLKQDYPEVQEAVRLIGNDRTMYKNGDLHFYEDKTFFADSNVFKVFTFPFIEGNPQTALVEPKSMVLTESVAIKFFGKSYGVVGKTLQNDEGDIYKITGVIKDVPKNSHILFNALISESTLPKDLGNWGNFNIFTYVLLNPHTDGPTFERKLAPMYDKYMASIFKVFNIKINYGVQPVPSIHLHSDLEGEPEELGSMSYIYILGSVAFFMLLIACINYMNLATARSGRRAKEIGIRKVTGSSKSQLIAQFLIESTLMAVFALLLGVVLIAVLLPSFNSLAGKFISWRLLLEPETFLILLGIVVFVGVVGGSYPAFYLSKFNPISTLKGALSKSSSNATLRRVLVVIQFSIAMTMLICTWVVYGQLNYLRKVDTGFNKDQVLCLRADANRDIRSNIQAFKDEARKNAGILSVSSSQATPGQGVSFSLFHVQTDSGYKDKAVFNYDIDENYFGTLGMQMKAGRNFSGLPDTLHGAIVNENMVKYFGWKNAIGQIIKRPGDTSDRHWVVVGVVKDFNQQSLYNPMAPVLLFYRPNRIRKISPVRSPPWNVYGKRVSRIFLLPTHSWTRISIHNMRLTRKGAKYSRPFRS
jgi:putative ABC transport system permease protein